jgi:hypothetical protein
MPASVWVCVRETTMWWGRSGQVGINGTLVCMGAKACAKLPSTVELCAIRGVWVCFSLFSLMLILTVDALV